MSGRHYSRKWTESSFCVRNRALVRSLPNGKNSGLRFDIKYEIKSDSVLRIPGGIFFNAGSVFEDKPFLKGEIIMYSNGSLHVYFDEISPLHPRFRIPTADVLNEKLLLKISDQSITLNPDKITFEHESNKFIISLSPFQITGYYHGVLCIKTNANNYMNFERYRSQNQDLKPKSQKMDNPIKILDGAGLYEFKDGELRCLDGLWSETYKNKIDVKSRGPSSVACDVEFEGSTHIYGLALHSTDLVLKDTIDEEPYRLFNFDSFMFGIDERSSLYGSSTFIMSKNKQRSSAGVFWMNASDTWVDISTENSSKRSHWMSEAGIIEFVLLMAPYPLKLIENFTVFTGPAPMPPIYALGYHQSKWNYNSKDVYEVSEGFDKHNLPLDAIYSDIDSVNGYQYLTWNYDEFPDPIQIQDYLALKGRKLHIIADPHVKRTFSFPMYAESHAKNLLVTDKNGYEFMEDCWPGNSCWLDVTRSETRDLWASYISFEGHADSTPALSFWNDMNEPAVFFGPEKTLPKAVLHGIYEHREVHNLYGHYFQRATYEGVTNRNAGTERAFVLARAYFTGSQRYGATWTGDSANWWEYLDCSLPMLLSQAIGGISFSGGDIGGYFYDPGPDLYARWYQIGAWLPFYRGHSDNLSKRREPWLYGSYTMSRIREALKDRYRLLPYWYTNFYEYSSKGTPLIIPMFVLYPYDEKAALLDRQFHVGLGILVAAIHKPRLTTISLYLPEARWYDYHTYTEVESGPITYNLSQYYVPSFIKGGYIIPRQDKARSCTRDMLNDPYTLIIALDEYERAFGKLYIDDTQSFRYQNGEFIYADLSYQCKEIRYELKNWMNKKNLVKKILILGMKNIMRRARIENSQRELEFKEKNGVVVIKNPGVFINENWIINIE